MRRRLLLSAASLVVIACVVLLVLAMLPARPGVTKANFDRIKEGMRYDEVETMLGKPNGASWAGRFHERKVWLGADGSRADIAFLDGQVSLRIWFPSSETTVDRIRRWLGVP